MAAGDATEQVSVGDPVPDVALWVLDAERTPAAVPAPTALGEGRVLLLAVPGAFTPGCSAQLPTYLARVEELRERGIDWVACVATNDAWAMDAWARDQGGEGEIVMLSDGNGDFTRAMGMGMDGAARGLGFRSRRYVAIIEGGVFVRLEAEQQPGINVTACERLLDVLERKVCR